MKVKAKKEGRPNTFIPKKESLKEFIKPRKLKPIYNKSLKDKGKIIYDLKKEKFKDKLWKLKYLEISVNDVCNFVEKNERKLIDKAYLTGYEEMRKKVIEYANSQIQNGGRKGKEFNDGVNAGMRYIINKFIN